MDPVINFAKAGTETCNSGKKWVVGDEGGICTLKDVSYSVFLILPELPRGWAGRGGGGLLSAPPLKPSPRHSCYLIQIDYPLMVSLLTFTSQSILPLLFPISLCNIIPVYCIPLSSKDTLHGEILTPQQFNLFLCYRKRQYVL